MNHKIQINKNTTPNKKDKLMYHKNFGNHDLNLLLPFRLTHCPTKNIEKQRVKREREREQLGTTERALISMKTRETKKQKREGAEHCVQELKKKHQRR